jgi:short-subunit dehydrogenase
MHVAITGASTGIGEGLAREFARAGARLTLVARRKEKMEGLAKELRAKHPGAAGEPAHFVAAVDLADPERATEWIAPAEAALGPIDVLVNNAGVYMVAATAAMDVQEGERLLRLNLFTPLRIIRAALPAMIARRSGTIVNVASAAALAPTPGLTYYNASKGGLAAASEALRGELRGTGVQVVTVYPGMIKTDMMVNGKAAFDASPVVELMPVGSTASLARHVLRAVVRRRGRVIYPHYNRIARVLPTFTRWMLDRYTPPVKTGGSPG